MEIAIAIFLGLFTIGVGIVSYIRISKDFDDMTKDDKQNKQELD